MNNRSPYVTIEAWIKKIGYVPGESIYFNAKIRNCRDKSIRKSYVKHTKETVIFKGEKGKIGKNEEFLWDKYPIVIPQLPPSKFEYCQLIDVSYVIMVSCLPL